jgi:hypothetical protein
MVANVIVGPIITTLNSAEFEVQLDPNELDFESGGWVPVMIGESRWKCFGIKSVRRALGIHYCTIICLPFDE